MSSTPLNHARRLLGLLVVLASAICALAQTTRSKKVFMITDMEGVDGIFNSELQCIPFQSPRWEESRKLLTGEVNAAVDALFGTTPLCNTVAHQASKSAPVC